MIDATAFKETLNDKPVAVFGLGASGLATVEWLVQSDIKTIAWDDLEASRKKAEELGAEIIYLNQEALLRCACLVLSPGVPLTHPIPHDVVKAAQAVGCEIIGDIEILQRSEHGHTTIAITGTNGKSTTTALLTHVLNACGKNAIMGGNIGVPALAMDPPNSDTIFVLEISSYQVDLSPTFAPDISVLLNVTPDHIDRHGSFENYKAIKEKLLDSGKTQIRGIDENKVDEELSEKFASLPGSHNKQNILAVVEVCKALGINKQQVIEAVKSFPGLSHRQYLVRAIGAVKYINDSKATNAEAAAKALASYQNIYWIVGGQAKEGGLEGLEEFSAVIRHAYLIGEAAPEFESWMIANNVRYTIAETLENATNLAHEEAQSSDANATILLSPACASWDQFKSFEDRGDQFSALVEGLEE